MNRTMLIAGAVLLVIGLAGCCVERPNVVIVIVDTMRADHMGAYGYHRDTTPGMDSLARAGTIWTNARGQASWTLPAITSIFTGRSARAHGTGINPSSGSVSGIGPDIPTMATILGEEGYNTAAFFNVFLLNEQFGFHRGFDTFNCHPKGLGRAGETVDEALDWLDEQSGDDPFFLAVHLFDPHDPYAPPAPYDTMWGDPSREDSVWIFTPEGAIADPEQRQHLIDSYDGEIAWTDSQLSRLMAGVRSSGMAGNTLIIVTADHGEEFLEHGYGGHGRTLFEEIVHIPLIMSGYGVPPGEVRDCPAAQMDILPTALEIADVEHPDEVRGIDLLSGNVPEKRSIPASGVNTGPPFLMASVTRDSFKTIWYPETDTFELYHLRNDPDELNPLSPGEERRERVLTYWATPRAYPPQPVEGSHIEPALRDLGYF